MKKTLSLSQTSVTLKGGDTNRNLKGSKTLKPAHKPTFHGKAYGEAGRKTHLEDKGLL